MSRADGVMAAAGDVLLTEEGFLKRYGGMTPEGRGLCKVQFQGTNWVAWAGNKYERLSLILHSKYSAAIQKISDELWVGFVECNAVSERPAVICNLFASQLPLKRLSNVVVLLLKRKSWPIEFDVTKLNSNKRALKRYSMLVDDNVFTGRSFYVRDKCGKRKKQIATAGCAAKRSGNVARSVLASAAAVEPVTTSAVATVSTTASSATTAGPVTTPAVAIAAETATSQADDLKKESLLRLIVGSGAQARAALNVEICKQSGWSNWLKGGDTVDRMSLVLKSKCSAVVSQAATKRIVTFIDGDGVSESSSEEKKERLALLFNSGMNGVDVYCLIDQLSDSAKAQLGTLASHIVGNGSRSVYRWVMRKLAANRRTTGAPDQPIIAAAAAGHRITAQTGSVTTTAVEPVTTPAVPTVSTSASSATVEPVTTPAVATVSTTASSVTVEPVTTPAVATVSTTASSVTTVGPVTTPAVATSSTSASSATVEPVTTPAVATVSTSASSTATAVRQLAPVLTGSMFPVAPARAESVSATAEVQPRLNFFGMSDAEALAFYARAESPGAASAYDAAVEDLLGGSLGWGGDGSESDEADDYMQAQSPTTYVL